MKRLFYTIIALSAFTPSIVFAEDGGTATPPVGGNAPQGNATNAILSMLLWMLPLVFLFYFFLIRPESKRRKQHQQMVASLEKGDTIVTIGGMYGKIVEVRDDKIVLQVDDSVRLRMSLDSIARKIEEEE